MKDLVIVPTLRSRIIASLKIAAWPLTVLLAFQAAKHNTNHVQHLSPCDSLPWLRAYAALAVLIAFGFSLYLARSGVLAWRSRQYPAPGTSVLFRTKVSSGWWARFNAAGMLGFSALLAFVLFKLLEFFVFSEFGFYILGLRNCEA